MTIFAMQPGWMGAQPYAHGVKRVEDAVSLPQNAGDEVTEAIDMASAETHPTDETRFSAAGEMLAVELDGESVRWEKIAALRAWIAAGKYRIPSEAIAEKMMNAMRR